MNQTNNKIFPFIFNLSLLSDYRTEIMGFAALCIILCHANVAGVATPAPIHYLLGLGNVGVDIFLFVSGLGMYYSLTKRGIINYNESINRGGVKCWYLDRYRRILVPYFIITFPWWVYYAVSRQIGLGGFLLHVSTLGYWFWHYGAWYVALLMPLYLLTPPFATLVEKVSRWSNFARYLIIALLCVLLWVLTSIHFDVQSVMGQAFVNNLQMAFSRAPIYLIGYGVAPFVKDKLSISWLWLVLCPIIMVSMDYIPYVCHWYRAWLLALPFMMIVCQLLQMFKQQTMKRVLHFIGLISLESYLANVFVTYALEEFDFQSLGTLNYGNYMFYFLVILLGMTIAILANKLSKKVITIFIKQ